MSRLLIILVLILTLLIIGSVIYFSFFAPKKTSVGPDPIMQASIAPSPYRKPSGSVETPSETKLELTGINPEENTDINYLPVKQVFFSFNKPMNPGTFSVKIAPEAEILLSLKQNDSNTIVVSPQKNWQEGITTITVLSETTSADGAKLEESFSYKINSSFPKNPPPDSPGL